MPRFPVGLLLKRSAVATRRGSRRVAKRISRVDGPDVPVESFAVGAAAASVAGGAAPAAPPMAALMRGAPIKFVPPLSHIRRDLKAMSADLPKELNYELREAAAVVAEDAASLAPRRTGALARSYKPFVRGNAVGVRSRLAYAPVHEWGGTIRPRGVPISIQRSAPVTQAVERNADRIVDDIGDRIDALALRHGFE